MSDERTGGSAGVLPLQRLAAWGLRGFAFLTALGGLLASVAFWVLALETPEVPWPTLALVLLQGLFAIAVVAWTALLWRRGRALGALETRDYPAITCVVVCTRLIGEVLAIGFVLSSLALAVISLASVEPLASNAVAALDLDGELIEPASWTLAVLLAILWPLAGLFAAGMALLGAYLFADAMTAMLEYVRDVRRIRETLASRSAK